VVLPAPAPAPGWSSYALCTGSGYGHFINAWHPEYHNGVIIQPDRGTSTMQRSSDLTSDTAGRSGYQSGLSCQIEHSLILSST